MEKNQKCALNLLDRRGLLVKAQVITDMDTATIAGAVTDIFQIPLRKLVNLPQFLYREFLFKLTMVCSYLSLSFAGQMESQENLSAANTSKPFGVRGYIRAAFSACSGLRFQIS